MQSIPEYNAIIPRLAAHYALPGVLSFGEVQR